MDTTTTTALDRIWAEVLQDPRRALETTLSPTDLQTLLLAVAKSRSDARSPADLMRRWREDRYVQPAASNPRDVARVEAQLWDLLPTAFSAVALSPVTPLGTCSAVAPVHQDRVLSTIRNTEVVSDLTNALAIEAAWRRRTGDPTVHLAACHAVLRMQHFPAPFSQHFRLFALVSTTRDTGGGTAEARLLTDHLRFWAHALPAIAPHAEFHFELTGFKAVLQERLMDSVLPELHPLPPSVTASSDAHREQGRGYYTSGALRILGSRFHNSVELGDGGLTDWSARLLANGKERCLISCISTERLTHLAAAAYAAPSAHDSTGA